MNGPSPAAIELARAMRARRGPDGWPKSTSPMAFEYWMARRRWYWHIKIKTVSGEVISIGKRSFRRKIDCLRTITLVRQSHLEEADSVEIHADAPAKAKAL